MKTRQTRNSKGMAMLALILGSTVVMSLLGMFFIESIMFASMANRCVNAADCSALLAAKQLGSVVIEDEHFGHVALIDRAAEESQKKAEDGRELPVTGINTLFGSIRLRLLLAERLQNPFMRDLALRDLALARQTARNLEKAIEKELAANTKKTIYACALDNYKNNLALGLVEEQTTFKAELGILKSGSCTITPVPDRKADLDTPAEFVSNGNYNAFMIVPTAGEKFSFAGLGAQPGLVSGRTFQTAADECQIRSVVRITAQSTIKTPLCGNKLTVSAKACAQPGGEWQTAKTGALIAYFYGGSPEACSIASLSSDHILGGKNASTYTSTHGDYPVDSQALLQTIDSGSFAKTTSTALYDWVGQAGVKPQLADLLSFLNTPLADMERHGSRSIIMNPAIVANFDENGVCQYQVEDQMPVEEQITAQGQVSSECSQAITTNRSWNFTCRNYVHNLGENGGKHAGLPLEIGSEKSPLLADGVATIFDLHVVPTFGG